MALITEILFCLRRWDAVSSNTAHRQALSTRLAVLTYTNAMQASSAGGAPWT